jgi:LacI family transcriptional regulator
MAVRLKDIAEALGISKVTVSKVLRGAPDVGERTRKLVLEQMKALDYRPNMHARGLAGGRSYAVGLIVPDLVTHSLVNSPPLWAPPCATAGWP